MAASVARKRAAGRLILVLALGAAAAWYFGAASRSPADRLVLYGNVDIRQVDLAFNESDRVVRMNAEEGDAVTRGQLLAELDDARLKDVVAQADAALAAQRAVVSRLEHGSRPQEIAQARAEVARVEAELRDASARARRQKQLLAERVATKQAYDAALAAFQSAEARVEAARENLRLFIEGPRVEDIEAARARLLADEKTLALARRRLADTKLHAPADGTILTRILEPGAVVLANTPVYTLAVADPVWVRAYVSEKDLGRVYPGMKAEIRGDSFPDRVYHGWVGFISPTAEFTPKTVETPDLRTSLVYRIRVYAENPDRTLRQGMPVTVALPLDQAPAAAKAPRQSKTGP